MEKTKEQKTCEQRIDEQLRSRLDDLLPDVNSWSVLQCARHLKTEGVEVKTADIEELRQQVQDLIRERACENVLSVEKITTYNLCLSWGGPADYFELDWAEDSKEWKGGRYVFQDWFDGASRRITAEQAAELSELFGIYPDAA